MTPSDLPLELWRQTAITAAHSAGEVLLRHWRGVLAVREKPKDRSLVSNADLAAEKAILSVITARFPDHGLLTEESPEILSQLPARWVIDPLDGTTNYIQGLPHFCVSIAVQWHESTQVGVIYQPLTRQLFVATRGEGAFLDGEPIHVSTRQILKEAVLTAGFGYARARALNASYQMHFDLGSRVRAIRRLGSAALDLAYTAQGIFDGYWERGLAPWDVAAGALLVTEAGGQVTTFAGKKHVINGREILATNALLHQPLSEALMRAQERARTGEAT